MANDGANESYLRDALGSTVALTDSSQGVQDRYAGEANRVARDEAAD